MLLSGHASLLGRTRSPQQHLTTQTSLQLTCVHKLRIHRARWAPCNPVKHCAIPNEDAQLANSPPDENDAEDEDTTPAPRDDDVCF